MFNMIGNLLEFCVYMLPTIVAWYRRKEGKSIVIPLPMLGFMNFFLGWTIVGWLLPMANALGYNPVAAVAPKLADVLIKYGRVQGPPAAQGNAQASGGQGPCGTCGGSGRSSCPSCGGSGHSWGGDGQQHNCTYCIGSGRVQCMTCGGTGRSQALI